jgi:hypothetical protein
VTASQALRAGLRLAFSRSWPALALFAAGAGELFAASAVPLLLFGSLVSGDVRVLWAGAVGLGTGWVLCRVARAVILYAALGPGGPATALRALGYFALSSALELTARLWWWTGLVASAVAFVKQPGAGASLSLSVTLSGGLLLGLFVTVWADLALARSASRGEPFSRSLAEAARALAERPGAPVLIVLVTGLLRWSVEVGASTFAAVAGPLAPSGVALVPRALAGLVAALAWAVLELGRLFALQALDRETPVLAAVPVDAPGSAG